LVFTGEGEMLLAPLPVKSGEGYKVPLLRQKVSCGSGINWQDENNIVEYIDVFDQIPRLKIERLFALRVEGSSMMGVGIRDGNYILFNSAEDQWTHDGIYVFALDGEVLCKRLEFDRDKIKIYSVRFADLDKVELVATIGKDNSDRLTIFGRVLYWVHPNLDE
jgi:SOS-response transcriptional repressor LexA